MADHLPKFKAGQAVTFTAGGTIAGGQVVEVGAADRTVVVAGAASLKAIGTAGFSVVAGDRVTVHLAGPVDTAKAAAAIVRGAKVEAGAAGTVQTATTGLVLGIALTAAADAGDVIEFVRA